MRAVEELRATRPEARLLIALPAFRVGRGGDRGNPMFSARAQIQAAVSTLQEVPNVDVAFVTYTPALYRVFLQARREVVGPPQAASYPVLEQALTSRACVLFVGAGLSTGAGLPGWNELIARLSRDLQVEPSPRIDHLDLAQWYREQFGNERLANVLRSTFGGEGLPTLAHYLLMGLPIRHVITTNYDQLLEQTLDSLKRHPVPIIHQEEVAGTGGAGTYVVKLHGDARHPEEIVLSRDDYATFFERRPAMAILLEGLLLNQTFFFVGYSLRDPNFRQVFGRIARLLRESRRRAFAMSFEARGDTADYLQKQWHRQQLELIPVPGDSAGEQQQAFLRFLDALADRVTLQAAPLSLAADVPVSDHLAPLRGMLEQVGAEVVRLSREPAAEADLAFLADTLDFLADHGWRPPAAWHRPTLCLLYQQLAVHASDEATRRRLLVAALGCAEALAEVRRLREEMEG